MSKKNDQNEKEMMQILPSIIIIIMMWTQTKSDHMEISHFSLQSIILPFTFSLQTNNSKLIR